MIQNNLDSESGESWKHNYYREKKKNHNQKQWIKILNSFKNFYTDIKLERTK